MSTDLIVGIIVAYSGISLYRQLRRAEKLVEEIPAKIEKARHEGWLEGVLYQAELEKRRHPRDPKTKQFVCRT